MLLQAAIENLEANVHPGRVEGIEKAKEGVDGRSQNSWSCGVSGLDLFNVGKKTGWIVKRAGENPADL